MVLNGAAIAGANQSVYTIANAGPGNAGNYTVVVGNANGNITSSPATLTIGTASDLGHLINISVLTSAGSDAQALTVGFVVGGSDTSESKPILVRGNGPGLTQLGVTGVLADPKLQLYQINNAVPTLIQQNDDW